MSQADTGGPAFPRAATEVMMQADEFAEKGMTLLDYFAGQALPKVIEDYCRMADEFAPNDDGIARTAYGVAAAMIAEKRRRETVPPTLHCAGEND